MNLRPHEQEQLRLVLAQIDDCKQTALDAIDGTLKGLEAAEEILGEILAAQAETAGPSGDSAERRVQEAVSVVSNIGSFLDFAIAVISAWQGNSWAVIHPDPLEYGLFGFKGKQLRKVLDRYFSRTNESLPQQPLSLSWYSEKAKDPQMREAQLAVAREFLLDVTRLSIEPRGIGTPLGQLMIMDAAVDHGLTHDILKRAEINLGLDVIKADGRYVKPYIPMFYDDEALYVQRFALERMQARKARWAEAAQESTIRLRERYEWFEKLAYERDMKFEAQDDGAVHLGSINIRVPLPDELLQSAAEAKRLRSTAQASAGQLAYGSPVDPNTRAVLPPGWCSAIDHGEIYQHSKFKGQMHTGLDINRCDDKDEGLPVFAVADGLVVFAGVGAGSWGNLVVIQNPDGIWSRYGHLKTIAPQIGKGATSAKGALLGSIGRGHKQQFNAHLHFDMCNTSLWQGNPSCWSAKDPAKIESNYVDPVAYIAERGWWLL